jgi:hypothetical protein
MASTAETGHAKNIATFEDLISFCTGYEAAYNPSKAALKLTALNTQLATASESLQAVKEAKTAHDNATNARELAFKPLKPLATKIVSSLSATDALRQTVNDAKSINSKIQGKRAKAIARPDAKVSTQSTAPARTASTSQQSFDKLVDHFAQLLTALAAETKYTPNETALKLTTLNTLLTDLRTKNTSVIATTTALSNTRIARDEALYDETTGIVATALDVKTYIKSVFGASSPQFKQVSALKFTRRAAD